jgi:hypothetical protein
MPSKSHTPLPEPLKYLQPFMRSLAKLPPEEVNEGVDASRLEAALRKRLRGLDEDEAAEALSSDCELLDRWLKDSASVDHPAYWVPGYLSSPEILAELLTRPPEPPPPVEPEVGFSAPHGWKVTVTPYGLNLKKGKLSGTIMPAAECTFERRQWQQERWTAPPDLQAMWEILDVRFGDVVGKKYIYRQVGPVSWKGVDYVLSVPGGFVTAMLCASGADFDESPFEAKLHTLRDLRRVE